MASDPKKPGKKSARASTMLLRGSALQMIAFSFAFGVAFFMMPYLIHHLGQRTYGLWVLIGTIVGQLGIMDVGLMSTTQRFLSNAMAREAHDECVSIYSTSTAIFVGLGTLVFLAVIAVALSAGWWLHKPAELHSFQIALMLSGLNLALLFPFAIMQAALNSSFRSDAASVSQIVNTFLRLVLTIIIISHGYGIVAISVVILFSSLTQRSILSYMLRRHLPHITFRYRQVTWAMTKQLFAFGWFVALLKITDGARYRFDNLIIAPMVSIEAVTHYSVAARLSDYFDAIMSRISSVSSPVYARHFALDEHNEMRVKYLSLSRFCAIICCVFAGSGIVFGRQFMRLWLGTGFDDSYFALSVLLLAMLFALLQSPSRSLLLATYMHGFNSAKTNLIEAVCNLALTVLLIPKIGILGAAIGTAIPMLVVKAGILPAFVCRKIDLPLWRYYQAVGAPVLTTTIICAIASAVLPLTSITSLSLFCVAGGVYATILLLALMALVLPREDKAALARAIGPDVIKRLPAGGHLYRFMTGNALPARKS